MVCICHGEIAYMVISNLLVIHLSVVTFSRDQSVVTFSRDQSATSIIKKLQRAIIDGQYYMFKNDRTIKDEWNVS